MIILELYTGMIHRRTLFVGEILEVYTDGGYRPAGEYIEVYEDSNGRFYLKSFTVHTNSKKQYNTLSDRLDQLESELRTMDKALRNICNNIE